MAAYGARQVRQDLAPAAGTFARIIGGHLGPAATFRPATPPSLRRVLIEAGNFLIPRVMLVAWRFCDEEHSSCI